MNTIDTEYNVFSETLHFGHADTLRFLTLQQTDHVDYLELREHLFTGMSARELYQQAADFWQQRQTTSANS